MGRRSWLFSIGQEAVLLYRRRPGRRPNGFFHVAHARNVPSRVILVVSSGGFLD